MENKIAIAVEFNASDLLHWYKGKSAANVAVAVGMLQASAAQGYWEKGASRKVRAALNKANVAQKFAKMAREFYQAISYDYDSKSYASAWHSIYMSMMYVSDVDQLLAAVRLLTDMPESDRAATLPMHRTLLDFGHVLDNAICFYSDLKPVLALCALLDSRRPAPCVRVLGTLSPTVAKTLVGANLELKLATLRYPEVEAVWVDRIAPDGTKYQVQAIRIIWPKGTVHNSSRFLNPFNGGRAQHEQCHACGHAIKNALNWVPFLVDDARGVPHSFWVGSDCARKIFGCEVSGEAEYTNRKEG